MVYKIRYLSTSILVVLYSDFYTFRKKSQQQQEQQQQQQEQQQQLLNF